MSDTYDLDFLQHNDSKIPIPSVDHLKNLIPKDKPTLTKDADLKKHGRAYDAFCRWISLPEDERDPKTITGFERKWKVPNGYSTTFRQRGDFVEKVFRYFWDWMIDHWPMVVKSIYKGALKGNATQAKTFAELISKRVDMDKPVQQIQPLMIVGVPNERIEKLFIPKGMRRGEVENIIPVEEGGE